MPIARFRLAKKNFTTINFKETYGLVTRIEVSQLTGVSEPLLWAWEKAGLLKPLIVSKNKGLSLFSPLIPYQVSIIKILRRNFSLQKIKGFLK